MYCICMCTYNIMLVIVLGIAYQLGSGTNNQRLGVTDNVSSQQSGVTDQQLGVTDQQPSVAVQQSGITYHQPDVSSQQPSTGHNGMCESLFMLYCHLSKPNMFLKQVVLIIY